MKISKIFFGIRRLGKKKLIKLRSYNNFNKFIGQKKSAQKALTKDLMYKKNWLLSV